MLTLIISFLLYFTNLNIIKSKSTSCTRHQMGKEHTQFRRHKIRTARAKSQEDSSFPADGHQAILNKINKISYIDKQKADEQCQIEKHHGSTILEWSVSNYRSAAGMGVLIQFYVHTTVTLGPGVVHYIYLIVHI